MNQRQTAGEHAKREKRACVPFDRAAMQQKQAGEE